LPDILAQMDFTPVITRPPRLMDARIFRPYPMGLREDLLRRPLAERFSYDPQQNVLFVNLEGHVVKTEADVQAVREQVEQRIAPLGKKVFAIINYDNFTILPDVTDSYAAMVKGLVERFDCGVSRYTTSTFLRMKRGDALRERDVAPHIHESAEEAHAFLRKLEGKVTG